MSQFSRTKLNQVRRLAKRAQYDKEAIYGIIDEALICHVGFVQESQPFVIPMNHARQDDTLYLHGSRFSRLLKHFRDAAPVCVSITLLDGIVFARSVFHHSMNYRSVVLFGKGRALESEAEKLRGLEVLTEHIAQGRWADARKPNPKELEVTSVIAVSIKSASAKVRTGPPIDEEEDYPLPIWAGIIPIKQQTLNPIRDPRLLESVALPDYLSDYSL